jgi:hypothetical protein
MVSLSIRRVQLCTDNIPREGIDGKWSSFGVRVGNPAQPIRVLVSTNSPDTLVVLAEGCTDQRAWGNASIVSNCANSRGGTFNTSISTTWHNQGDFGLNQDGVGFEANLEYTLRTDVGLETVGLGYDSNAGPILQNQTIAAFESTSPFYL